MSVELETKLKVDSHEQLRQKLSNCNANVLTFVLETNYLLDDMNRSLNRAGRTLRIRSAQSLNDSTVTNTITLKGPKQQTSLKSRVEHEVTVSDSDTAITILETLGLVTVFCFQKKRESWQFNTCRVELDEVPHLGLFVEIEGPSEQGILAAKRDLGLGDLPHIKHGYAGMLARWCEENNHPSSRILFPSNPT